MVNIHQIKGLDERISAVETAMPSNVSDLINDTGYLTSEDIADLIDGIKFEVVQELPTANIKTNVIYILRNDSTTGNNLFTEYIYVRGAWEVLGSHNLGLSGYLKKDDVSVEVIQTQSQVTTVDNVTVNIGDSVLRIVVGSSTYYVLINKSDSLSSRINTLESTIGTQILANFTANNDSSDISATDTLLSALSKLQSRIKNLEQNVIFADNS